MQRPANFDIDYSHPLAKGLVFAGLGAHAGGTRYHDSSLYEHNGTLTNMDPSTDWVVALGRRAVVCDTTDKKVITSGAQSITVNCTISMWFNGTNTPAHFGRFATTAVSEVGIYREAADTQVNIQINGTSGVIDCTDLWGTGWHHLAFQWTQNIRKMFVDGKQSGSTVTTAFTFPTVSSDSLYIGNYSTLERTGGGQFSDVIIHNRALYPTEIQQLADPSNVMLSGLIRDVGNSHNVYDMEGIR